MKEKPGDGRIPFPSEPFFAIPIKLFDCGLARELTSSEFKRYATFSRLANFHQRNDLKVQLEELEVLDGISVRRAHEIHPRLEERGMIVVERNTRPHTYVLLHPSQWRDRTNRQRYPPSRLPRSYVHRP
jgi:hypothetical protein